MAIGCHRLNIRLCWTAPAFLFSSKLKIEKNQVSGEGGSQSQNRIWPKEFRYEGLRWKWEEYFWHKENGNFHEFKKNQSYWRKFSLFFKVLHFRLFANFNNFWGCCRARVRPLSPSPIPGPQKSGLNLRTTCPDSDLDLDTSLMTLNYCTYVCTYVLRTVLAAQGSSDKWGCEMTRS